MTPFPPVRVRHESVDGRLSMKELTEKTARPAPGGPYPGGLDRP